MPERLTTGTFIAKAKEVYSDAYDYSKVVYVNMRVPITILCKDHGEFYPHPYTFVKGSGCFKCKCKSMTTEEFIIKAMQIHGSLYDYSKTIYTRAMDKVEVGCKEHGFFWQQATGHLRRGCPKCSQLNNTPSTKEFIAQCKEVHKDKYDYSKTVVTKLADKVTVICPEHGEFYPSAFKHLRKSSGCHTCKMIVIGKKRRRSAESFIEQANKVHANQYDYSLIDFQGVAKHVNILCSKHGVFSMTPRNHLAGSKCRDCIISLGSKYVGYNEIHHLKPYLEDINADFIQQYATHTKEGLFLIDFYYPKLKVAIEYDERHHRKPSQQAYDKNRERLIKETLGCKIIRIDDTKFMEDKKEYYGKLIKYLGSSSQCGT